MRHLHLAQVAHAVTLQVIQARRHVPLVRRARRRGKPSLRRTKAQEIGQFLRPSSLHRSSSGQPFGPRWSDPEDYPAYRPATEKALETGLFLCLLCAGDSSGSPRGGRDCGLRGTPGAPSPGVCPGGRASHAPLRTVTATAGAVCVCDPRSSASSPMEVTRSSPDHGLLCLRDERPPRFARSGAARHQRTRKS